MEMINRAVVVVRPKQPFLDWAKLDDETEIAASVFQDMHDDPTVFLLPEYEDDDEQQAIIREAWPILFEAMLDGWLRDPDAWPTDRTFERVRHPSCRIRRGRGNEHAAPGPQLPMRGAANPFGVLLEASLDPRSGLGAGILRWRVTVGHDNQPAHPT